MVDDLECIIERVDDKDCISSQVVHGEESPAIVQQSLMRVWCVLPKRVGSQGIIGDDLLELPNIDLASIEGWTQHAVLDVVKRKEDDAQGSGCILDESELVRLVIKLVSVSSRCSLYIDFLIAVKNLR